MSGSNRYRGWIADRVRSAPWSVILPVVAVVALADTFVQWAVTATAGPGFQVTGFAVVAAAVVAGRPARWGSAAGLLCVGVLFGSWATAVTWAVAAFATTTVVVRLWVRDGADPEGWLVWTGRYAFVALVGILLFGATAAWLLDLLGRAAFSVTVGRTLIGNLPLAVLGAPLVRAASRRTPRGGTDPERPVTGPMRVGVALVALVWVVGGFVGSFLFRTVWQVPPGEIGRQFSPALERLLFLWGWQGTYAQLALGLVAVAVIASLLRR